MPILTRSKEETLALGEKLGKGLKNGLICLFGDLGSGKTTFVRGLAKGLGIKSRIQSPTFTYQRVHFGTKKLYHFDCYRISKPDELLFQDLVEAFGRGDGVVVVEWAENISPDFFDAVSSCTGLKARKDIYFKYIDENIREIKIAD
ncbi:MAG: tRNA (adenosine(37)-N6)-threonylcarbamoyltransferase complex ATPase subunit type 1 TsaE [Patescibacteria group bacterium]